jgi:hypothetical protein
MASSLFKPDMSKPITRKDWELVELYYIDSINSIHLPEDPKPYDITSLNSYLEALYHEVRLDFFYANRAFNNIENAYRKLKRALWPMVKAGKNQDERDHVMQNYLLQTTLDLLDANVVASLGLPHIAVTVYTLFDSYKERTEFLKAVLDLISDKTSRLITDSGAMKIESSLNAGANRNGTY